MTNQAILTAVSHLEQGGVIAYATEAVFGLGCDPDNQEAVNRLLAIKQRPVEKGLILIAADFSQLLPYLELDALPEGRLADILASWPGPNTWVMPAKPEVPAWLRGQFDSLAVRVSAHPQVRDLCLAFGRPLVSTSANLTGQEPGRTSAEVLAQLGQRLDYVLEGSTGGRANPSLIRDARTGAVIRPA
ncbi:Sua5/YciO/YrdC/YwlC family protein [Zobellella maritima]|uniref:Sua5/YciO/YrdC/YwlC family protein n=1 Tax=Zobellella maritima TaxID=2059725 RepID=UPI000E3069F2|nr:Sua5/YciO/YrdC/YwlC family protein [Zobellella maritima]